MLHSTITHQQHQKEINKMENDFNAQTHAVSGIPHAEAESNNFRLQDLRVKSIPTALSVLKQDSSLTSEISRIESSLDSLQKSHVSDKNNVTVSEAQRVLDFVDKALPIYKEGVNNAAHSIETKLHSQYKQAEEDLFTNRKFDMSPMDIALSPSLLSELNSTKSKIDMMRGNDNVARMALIMANSGYLKLNSLETDGLNNHYSKEAVDSMVKVNSQMDMLNRSMQEMGGIAYSNESVRDEIVKRMNRGKR